MAGNWRGPFDHLPGAGSGGGDGRREGMKGAVVRTLVVAGVAVVLGLLLWGQLAPVPILSLALGSGPAETIGSFHEAPAAEASGVPCGGCHLSDEPTASSAWRLPSTKEACLACHAEQRLLLSASVQHSPFGEGDCTACHRAHKTDASDQLRKPLPNLCLSCHADRLAETERASEHPPFAQGYCLACHDPHAASREYLLKDDEPNLCGSCHRGFIARYLTLPVQHKPFDDGKCTYCHTPHASDNEPQLRLPIETVCKSCHQDAMYAASSHPPVAQGLCAACHQPHASNFEYLLLDAPWGVCSRCHRR